jgi:Tc5 transposase-like DNA-binding protein
MAHNSTYEARIEAAISDLESQDAPKYRPTAKKYFLSHTTLRRRYLGVQLSRAAADSEYRQRLTTVQEEVLIKHINDFSDRGLPPTTQIVKNLAEEIIHDTVGKNWVSDFVRRKGDRLRSLYLRNIDNMRAKADYAPIFKHFYDQVRPYLVLFHT